MQNNNKIKFQAMKKQTLLVLFLFICQLTFSNVVVLNGLTHVHKSASGNTISGVIKLKNTNNTEQRIIIYFNNLFQKCGAETILTDKSTHNRSIGKWFSTNVNERVLKPNEQYELVYTIKVPNDSTLNGSYWGVLMVEIEKPIKEDQLEYGVKLQSKIRYGIQLIVDVNTPTPSELDFFNIKINKSGKSNIINVDVQNNGIYYVKATLVLEVFDENGKQVKKQEVKFKKIYPASCKAYSIDISDLPKGTYSASLVADYGGGDMYATDLEFEIK